MATKVLIRSPGFTLIERAMGISEARAMEPVEKDVSARRVGRRMLVIGAVQALLNILAITLIGLSAGAFIAGNTAVGVGALGPALAGIIGATGLQVRTIQRCIQGQKAE